MTPKLDGGEEINYPSVKVVLATECRGYQASGLVWQGQTASSFDGKSYLLSSLAKPRLATPKDKASA